MAVIKETFLTCADEIGASLAIIEALTEHVGTCTEEGCLTCAHVGEWVA